MRKRVNLRLLAVILVAGCAREAPVESTRPPDLADRLWDVVRSELRPDMSDEERAITIAEWVATNSTNVPRDTDLDALPFWGLCGRRAAVFEGLLEHAGFDTTRVHFDRFVDSAHAAAQVRFGGRWRYFDPTYAGYFRGAEGILSLEDLLADPERAIAGLVVFPTTLDRWSDGTPVDNDARMRRNYTAEHLRAAIGKECHRLPEDAPRTAAEGGPAHRPCTPFGGYSRSWSAPSPATKRPLAHSM